MIRILVILAGISVATGSLRAQGTDDQAPPLRGVLLSAGQVTEPRINHLREEQVNTVVIALDAADRLVYLAPSRVNLQLTIERWPDIRFAETRETVRFAD